MTMHHPSFQDYEAGESLTIRVQAKNEHNATWKKTFLSWLVMCMSPASRTSSKGWLRGGSLRREKEPLLLIQVAMKIMQLFEMVLYGNLASLEEEWNWMAPMTGCRPKNRISAK